MEAAPPAPPPVPPASEPAPSPAEQVVTPEPECPSEPSPEPLAGGVAEK